MPHVFEVQDMTCGHCEKAVSQALQRVDPEARVRIDRAQHHVEVDSTAARSDLLAAIAQEGYRVA